MPQRRALSRRMVAGGSSGESTGPPSHTLVVGSANVCTLCPRDEDAANAAIAGPLLMGKVQVMEMRFYEHSIRMLGVQEGRARRQEVRSGLHYDMFCGAASNSVGGCQVWVAKLLKFRLGEFFGA